MHARGNRSCSGGIYDIKGCCQTFQFSGRSLPTWENFEQKFGSKGGSPEEEDAREWSLCQYSALEKQGSKAYSNKGNPLHKKITKKILVELVQVHLELPIRVAHNFRWL